MLTHTRKWLTPTIAIVLLAGATSLAHAKVVVRDGERSPGSDFSSLNKSIRVGSHAEVGDLNAVNGSIDVGEASIVGDIETVNGGIDLEARVEARSVNTVNGSIRADREVSIERDVQSVNGRVTILAGGHVGGEVGTVNGGIRLDEVRVDGSIETYHGDVDLNEGTVIRGDLYVKRSRGQSSRERQRPTSIRIGPGVVIQGDLHFERRVELEVDATASIGAIHGSEFVEER